MKKNLSFPMVLMAILSFSLSDFVRGEEENLVINPGFEDGEKPWKLNIPSKEGTVGFSIDSEAPHSGTACAKLVVEEKIRFSIFTPKHSIKVELGERYKVSAWVKCGKDATLGGEPKDYGPYIRATMFSVAGVSSGIGNHHVGLNGLVRMDSLITNIRTDSLPNEWTKIEGVFETKEGCNMQIEIFFAGVTGTVFVDDVSAVKVSAETPLSN